MSEVIKSQNLDAHESIFFGRELEHIKAQTYDIQYPNLRAREMIPVSYEAGAGAQSITYQQFDAVGVARIIASYADDLPMANVLGREFTSPIRSLGTAYEYSIQEIRSAQMAGKSLDARKAEAARRANDQAVNRIGWFGDPTHGLLGMLTHPNIPAAPVANGQAGTPQWTTKTPDEILADMNGLVNGIVALTNGVEAPNTLMLPIAQYTHIATTPRSTVSDTTILDYFLKSSPFIKSVEWVAELAGAGPMGVDIMVAYERSPMKLTLEIPQDFEQFPAQEINLAFKVPCHSRIGGVVVYYPLSIAIGEDI